MFFKGLFSTVACAPFIEVEADADVQRIGCQCPGGQGLALSEEFKVLLGEGNWEIAEGVGEW